MRKRRHKKNKKRDEESCRGSRSEQGGWDLNPGSRDGALNHAFCHARSKPHLPGKMKLTAFGLPLKLILENFTKDPRPSTTRLGGYSLRGCRSPPRPTPDTLQTPWYPWPTTQLSQTGTETLSSQPPGFYLDILLSRQCACFAEEKPVRVYPTCQRTRQMGAPQGTLVPPGSWPSTGPQASPDLLGAPPSW